MKLHSALWKFCFALRPYRYRLMLAGLVCFMLPLIVACNLPAWIATASSILPIAANMAGGILEILAGFGILPGAASVLATVVAAAAKGLADAQSMVQEYQSNPSTTLLGDIESALKAVTDGIAPFLTDTGLSSISTKLASTIQGILQLLQSEVTSIASMLPLLKAAQGEVLTVTVPYDAKAFKQAYNSIIATPTGDEKVDAVLAKLHKL
jgi:hypothetical protein